MNNEIADTILAQLGGHRFRAMTGAKNLTSGARYLQFQLPRGAKNGINHVKTTLEINDTYTVQFTKFNARTLAFVVNTAEMVYGDNLRAVFTAHTGLDCTL